MKGKRRFLIGGVFILIGVVYLAYTGFQGAATYYYTVSEFLANPASSGKTVRVDGEVITGSIQQGPGELEMRFVLSGGDKSLPVAYRGAVPDAFGEGREVVVQGQAGADGTFQADSILTKCPSKYVPK